MSRYIDADMLEDKMYHEAFETDSEMQKWDSGCWIRYKMFENVIAEAPSIDIVRCKECRHWEMRNSPRGWCVVHQGYVSPQYFCADGERKESE